MNRLKPSWGIAMMAFALGEIRRCRHIDEPEPDWRQFLEGHRLDAPWPWRRETGVASP